MAAALLLALALVAPAAADPYQALPEAGADDAVLAALLLDPAVDEISGLAVSRRDDGLLWAINDSDNGNLLHALGDDGEVLASITVDGASNHDWEDLAAFRRDGRDWLLIADTGDNGGLRKDVVLYVVEEPVRDRGAFPARVDAAWRIRVRYADGPRDVEGAAVDVAGDAVLLLAKKRVPAQLFRVPLAPPATPDEVRVAEQIALATRLSQPTATQLAEDPALWRYRGQVTGLDLDPTGHLLAVLTYRDAFLYRRTGDESWSDALARDPARVGLPLLPQAEGLAFDRGGRRLWVTSEKLPAPLLRVDLR